jgi:DNA-binding MarR family transcriptional regulator
MVTEMSATPATEHPRFDSLTQAAFLNLWRTYDRLRALEDALFERYDLSPQQYNALRLLRSVSPGSMPTLAMGTRLISRAPDMTRLIDKLEARGWVSRERRTQNRRIVEVAISPAGLALLQELDEPVRQCAESQLGHLPEAQLKELIRLLELARRPHEEPTSHWVVKEELPQK